MNRRRALSLVELLIVTAVVVVLAGLTLTAVRHLREASARVACQKNLGQIGLALRTYYSGHRQFPGDQWATRLSAQLDRNATVFLCPADASPRPDGRLAGNYQFNGFVTAGTRWEMLYSGCALIIEGSAQDLGPLDAGPITAGINPRASPHKTGANCLFADSSVRTVAADTGPEDLMRMISPSGD